MVKLEKMNIVFILCVFFVFLLVNSGLSEKTSSGAYYVTSQPLTGKKVLTSNKTGILRPCHKHRSRVESFKQRSKSFIPQCYADGTYTPLQCHPASGYCWCVDKLGNEKAGTKSRGVISCGMISLERPCQRHRSRALLFSGLVTTQRSVFIPRCGKDGYYSPLQCLVRNTQCWCADKNGKEKKGTRRRGTAYCKDGEITRGTPDTFSATSNGPSKPCMRHKKIRDRLVPVVKRILFNPNCDKEGNYAAKQCFVGRCWCSTHNGKMIPGSKKKGNVTCDSELTETPDTFSATDDRPASNGGPCIRHKKARERFVSSVRRKLFNPNCNKEGNYAAKQCFARHCWCSTHDGKIVPGSKKKGNVTCESDLPSVPVKRTVCFTRRLESLQTSLFRKSFIPLCKSDGSFTPLQCNVYKGVCWCVDERGQELTGSRTRRTPNCLSKVLSRRPCNLHRKYVQQLPSIDKIHLPVCRDDGFFQPMQCSRNKDYCWCVKHDGTEILGTFTFGKPLCPDNLLNHTDVFNVNRPARRGPCMRHKEKRKEMLSLLQRDVFDPTCDDDGYYDAKQCNAKYCWCADRNGKMLAGSRKKGDVDCDESSVQAMKPCFAKRHKSLKMSLFKKAFIPQCTSDGFYTVLQCDVYSGVCWCVDKKGRELVGSRTKRTPKCFSNAFNTVSEGPCNLLQSHLKNFQTPNKIHEPICKGNGFFQQSQCSKNKEYCWCVMNDGTEIEGSITFDKPRCHEKPFPAVPIVRGPCEEHLFQLNNLQSDREVYIPICSAKGFYAPRQCNNNTGFCWCVDLYGAMIQGTRTTGTPICETLRPCHAFKKTPHQIKPDLNDVYNPVCTKDGDFAPLQCNVNNGKCWCVDKMGVEIPGTSIYKRPYCGKKNRACELDRRSYLSKKTNQAVSVAPSCDLHGYYSSIQCDHSSGECWCSEIYGKEVKGTRIKGMPNCGRIPRPCDEHASRTSNYDYVFGVHIPQCDSDGYYKDVQCHNQTNTCWCSNKIGIEISGTKTTGKPNCKF